MGKSLIARAVVVLFVLSGCSAQAQPAVSPPPPSTSPSPTPTQAATAQQFASLIAEHEAAIREFSSIDQMNCGLAVFHEERTDERERCVGVTASVASAMEAIIKGFDALPAPPAEVAALVQRTRDAIGDAGSTDFVGNCVGAGKASSRACSHPLAATVDATHRTGPVLDAWRPYTH
ncbi:hypothetical protein [Sinomonas soli]